MRKYEKHKSYTIEEKNEIVKKYLNGEMGYTKIVRLYDLASRSVLCNWIKQYRKYGTVRDNRGKGTAGKGNFNKRKKLIPEQMSREELIEYVKATEDIKKSMAFLKRQKKNIK